MPPLVSMCLSVVFGSRVSIRSVWRVVFCLYRCGVVLHVVEPCRPQKMLFSRVVSVYILLDSSPPPCGCVRRHLRGIRRQERPSWNFRETGHVPSDLRGVSRLCYSGRAVSFLHTTVLPSRLATTARLPAVLLFAAICKYYWPLLFGLSFSCGVILW